MRFSLRVNNDIGVGELVAIAVRAEELGFDQLWVSHDLFWRSAPVLLAVVARETKRLELGAGVMNPSSTSVVEIAMATATLQEVSGGRFRLGIGSGAAEFLGWAGIRAPRPLGSTRAAVEALRALLGGAAPPDLPAEGHLRLAVDSTPIYIGAMGPRMVELAGELGDGALPLLFPPERFATVRGQVAAGAVRSGRDMDAFDLAACVWVAVDEEPERARGALARKIAYYGASFAPALLADAGLAPAAFEPIQRALARGDDAGAVELVTPAMLDLGIAGDAAAVIERCRGLVGLGARHLSFGPPLGADPLAAVEVLGRQVLPALRY